jgi:hypothetical protein
MPAFCAVWPTLHITRSNARSRLTGACGLVGPADVCMFTHLARLNGGWGCSTGEMAGEIDVPVFEASVSILFGPRLTLPGHTPMSRSRGAGGTRWERSR